MTDAPGLPLGPTVAAVAYKLLRHIAAVERRWLDREERREGWAPADRTWLLRTFAECLGAVRGEQRRPASAEPSLAVPAARASSPRQELRELDFAEASIDQITDAFLENASLMLRNFIEPSRLEKLRHDIDRVYGEIEEVHVYREHMLERGLPDIDEYVFSDKHRKLAETVFAGFRHQTVTCARRMQPLGLSDDEAGIWQEPLPPHLDAFFSPLPFALKFWIPLQPCGIDAPSLGIVRIPFGEVLDFVGYHDDGELNLPEPEHNLARFNQQARAMDAGDAAAIELLRTRYRDRIWTPHYNLGDAMMMSNWTLHFTHSRPGMSRRRENVEIGLMCDATLQQILEKHSAEAAADNRVPA